MPQRKPDAPVILCPTDFGRDSALALAHAVGLALHGQYALSLLHIRAEHEAAPTRSAVQPVADLLIRWNRLAESNRYADLEEAVGLKVVGLDLPARSVVDGVIAHLDDHPFELAVLATHPTKGLSYWFAGSVGRRALRRANTMLLFVREGQRGIVDHATGVIRLHKALIPIDARIDSRVAIARASALIDEISPGVEKRLLHVGAVPPSPLPADLPLLVRDGPVVETILRVAKGWGADLIVMPTAGRRGVLSTFRDSITARILEDARWPVISVPAIPPTLTSAAST